jgi:hypothetical protein
MPVNVKVLHMFAGGCRGQNKKYAMIHLCMASIDTGMQVNMQ